MIIGGFCELDSKEKPFNTTIIIDSTGAIIGKYRKIHLFDVTLPEKSVYEKQFNAGSKPLLLEINNIRCGFTFVMTLGFQSYLDIMQLKDVILFLCHLHLLNLLVSLIGKPYLEHEQLKTSAI